MDEIQLWLNQRTNRFLRESKTLLSDTGSTAKTNVVLSEIVGDDNECGKGNHKYKGAYLSRK